MRILCADNRNALSATANRTWVAALMFVVCGPIYLDYWSYSFSERMYPQNWVDFFNGRANAPAQYRIGIPQLSRWMSQHLHIGLRHAFAIVDLIAIWISVLLLYQLLRRSLNRLDETGSQRIFCNALLLGLMCFYLNWLEWYQRPETLASGAFLVATLFLATHKLRFKGGRLLAVFLMLALAAWQGCVRADVGATLHLGILLVLALGRRDDVDGFAVGRWTQAGISLAALLIVAAIQVYIMRILYPQATYGGTPVIEARLNLGIMRLIPFVLFMTPVAVTWAMLVRHYGKADTGARVMMAASAIYLVVWFGVGSIAEERIFLPFALALAPWTSIYCADFLAGDGRLRAADSEIGSVAGEG